MEKEKDKNNDNYIIVTDRRTIESIFEDVLKRTGKQKNIDPSVEFENDRLSKSQVAKLADRSIPTIDKLVKKGVFKRYNLGARCYFLKSEVIEALRSNS